MRPSLPLILNLWLALVPAIAFQPISKSFRNGDVSLKMAAFGRSKASKIPTSPSERFVGTSLGYSNEAGSVDAIIYTALFQFSQFFYFWTCRDNLAIDSIKKAIERPKTPSFPLIECEFPPLASLNKLGDGSLRSANQVDDVRTR
jgi:hypothetical protein